MEIENLILINPEKRKREQQSENSEIDEWINKYIEERRFDHVSESTLNSDVPRIKVFLSYCYDKLNKSPDKLTKSDFIKFFNYLEHERKIKTNTQDKYFKNLRVFYRLMRLTNFDEFAEESKERKRFSRFETRHYDAVDEKQVNMILKKILKRKKSKTRIRDALVIRFLWDTGCRLSEALNLKYKDADLKEGVFKIRNTKGYVEREVICSDDTLNALVNYIKYNINQGDDDYIFQNHIGERITNGWISEVFRRAVKELKEESKLPRNKKIVLHSLRHGRTVALLDSGLPLEIVMDYMGHKKIDTTLYYAHSRERKQRMLKDIKKRIN
jgi:integrase/recombinase XerD